MLRINSILISFLALFLIVGCDSNGDGEIDDLAAECPAVGNITPTEIGINQCQIGGTLLTGGTLTSDVIWVLDGRFQVGTENDNAILTVDAGTQINGSDNDHVLVFPGSAIQANGTSADPVHFLSDDGDVTGSGEWGGLFLRGFNGLSTLTGTQGANILDYVVVSEAGAPVEVTIDGNTVNYEDNIVLNGVDDTTVLTFVQSHNSARDGFHILNGNPRLSWILATGSARDGVWYSNFTGLIKDLLVIHNPDPNGSSGRSGIYASETDEGNSNPRIVNATLVGRDSESTPSASDPDANEFGILFADNTDQIRLGNVLIANFRHGCIEADDGADLSGIDTDIPGPTYLDGIHCANEAGPNPAEFVVVRDDATGFPEGVIAPNNSPNEDGLVYYNGAGPILPDSNEEFDPAAGGINLTGEIADRLNNFTAGWYLDNIRGFGNGLLANPLFLNGFLDGDTNQDGVLDDADNGSPFIISADNPFNSDVAEDTFGYDLTHIGAVRGGAVTNTQFDNWTVATGPGEGFVVGDN